ncbi:hypothetical protein FALCPG4_008616 [Fusarium falciforme]
MTEQKVSPHRSKSKSLDVPPPTTLARKNHNPSRGWRGSEQRLHAMRKSVVNTYSASRSWNLKSATYLERRGRNRYAERRRAARRADTPYYPPDGTTFLRSLNGYLDDMGDIRNFRRVLGENTGNPKCFMLRSAELCKFALVDWRVPRQEHIRELGPNLALDRLYEAHVQELRQDDRLAQAREVARGHPQQYNLRLTQYWARSMLHEYEAAVEREEPLTDQTAPAV